MSNLTKGENQRVISAIAQLERSRQPLDRLYRDLIVAGRTYDPYINAVEKALDKVTVAQNALRKIALYGPTDTRP